MCSRIQNFFEDKSKKGKLSNSPRQELHSDFKGKTDEIQNTVNDLKVGRVEYFEHFTNEDFENCESKGWDFKIKVEIEDKNWDAIDEQNKSDENRLKIRDIAKLSDAIANDQKNISKCSSEQSDVNKSKKANNAKQEIDVNLDHKIKNNHKLDKSHCKLNDLKVNKVEPLGSSGSSPTKENFNIKFARKEKNKDKCIPFMCPHCVCKVTTKGNLKRHIQTSHEGKRYPCPHCEYKGTIRNNLKLHVLSIHEGKKYPCPQCDYKATTKNSLKVHVLSIHEGIKYPCSNCDYKAPTKQGLKKHMFTHEGVKYTNYTCSQCDSTFTLKTSLKTHIKKYHL